MGENTYQLIITNKITSGQNRNTIILKLAVLFKISEQQAEKLLSKPETVVKNNIDKATAEKYRATVQRTGALCKIINTEAKEPSLLEKSQAPSELDNISGKHFCTECGSIKDTADACLHCGFNPRASKTKTKYIIKYASLALALTAFVIGAYLFALPIYNNYSGNSRIANGLELAFDTRNKITAFILETNFWPNQNIDANLDKNISNEIIESIVVSENAVMTVTLRAQPLNADSNKTIIFKPSLLQGKLVWNCTNGSLDNEFRPDVCKSNQQ
jgi:hypothetical protein